MNSLKPIAQDRAHEGTPNAHRATGPYEPLCSGQDEFRLLTLKAGAVNDPIECQLRRVAFEQASKLAYETVSYSWGDATERCTIEVDGCEVSIPASAFQVLRRFRKPSEDIVLWIDAVCINQVDIDERSAQVARMDMIYKSARRNRVWLGDDDGTVQKALQVTYTILKEIRQETDNFASFSQKLHPLENDRRLTPSKSATSVAYELDLQPLYRLFSRPWFSRLWIVQEAALSPFNLCSVGGFDIPLVHILRVAIWLVYKRFHLQQRLLKPGHQRAGQETLNASRLHGFADEKYGWYYVCIRDDPTDIGIYSLLTALNQCTASDPRDYVYGMLALYQHFVRSGNPPALLQPDYSKSLAEVFPDATRYCIAEDQDLQVLQEVRHRFDTDDPSEVTLPSWVPRWHVKFDHMKDPKPLPTEFDAAGDHPLQLSEPSQEGPGVLKLKGLLVDGLRGGSVEILSEAYYEVHEFGSFLDTIINLLHDQGREQSEVDIMASLTAVLLCCSKGSGALVTEDDIRELKALLSFREWTGSLPTSRQEVSGTEQTKKACRFWELCHPSCKARRFFVTSTGRIGLGPPTMERGDLIALLYGGEFPYVLRRHDEAYEFVGSCYVHGIMFGEAIRHRETEGSQEVTFSIR